MDEGRSSSQQAAHLRFQQPHPAVQQSEYQQAALLLGRQEFSSCTAVSIVASVLKGVVSLACRVCRRLRMCVRGRDASDMAARY